MNIKRKPDVAKKLIGEGKGRKRESNAGSSRYSGTKVTCKTVD